ncbi:hypothetical protein A2U01_0073101, partial [Trifolium medium]|nr:hypothetical protein [Trifolium medium]
KSMDSRRQAILQEDGKGTIRGIKRDGVACRAVQNPRTIGCKRFFESTERNTSGAKEGLVEFVELSKIPMIVESKRFFESTERCTPGAEEGAVNLVGAT